MIDRKVSLSLVLEIVLLISTVSPNIVTAFSSSSYSIELEGFRWKKFPLKVLVDMNEWSTPAYAFAIHEALNSWILSLHAYASSFSDRTLRSIDWTFYVSNINSTSNYDVFITFAPNEVSPFSVGLTTYKWNIATHEPIPPVTISITTYSGSASHLFVKNVAMHELGHALGLGHTSSQYTIDGPELMYYSSTTDRVVYPSTLDIYGLSELYQGNFSRSIELPSDIPYKMVWPLTYGKISITAGVENIGITGAGIYRLGTIVTLRAPDSVELSNKTKLLFLDWYVPASNTSMPTPVSSIVVDSDITIILDWKAEYYIEITSIYGNLSYSKWVTKGETVILTSPGFESPADWRGLIGVRYRLRGWIVNGQFMPAGILQLSVDDPLSIEYVWEADYFYATILFSSLLTIVLGLILLKVIKQRKMQTDLKRTE